MGVGSVVLVAVVSAASASASASASSGWTVAEARTLLGRASVTATDAHQADRPTFVFRFQRGAVRPVGTAVGAGDERRWLRFAVVGTAADEASGTRIAVRFLIRATGAKTFAVENFRGPPPNRAQSRYPIRAAFYYPWYPENWSAGSFVPFTKLHPLLGAYDSGSSALIRAHIAALRYGRFSAAIASWWGQGSRTDRRVPALLAAARQTP